MFDPGNQRTTATLDAGIGLYAYEVVGHPHHNRRIGTPDLRPSRSVQAIRGGDLVRALAYPIVGIDVRDPILTLVLVLALGLPVLHLEGEGITRGHPATLIIQGRDLGITTDAKTRVDIKDPPRLLHRVQIPGQNITRRKNTGPREENAGKTKRRR